MAQQEVLLVAVAPAATGDELALEGFGIKLDGPADQLVEVSRRG